MIARLCGEPYARPDGDVLTCHYLHGHPTEQHSWWAAQTQDSLGTEEMVEIETVLDAIGDGRFDPYLEAILAAAHARKRTLRGVIMPYGFRES